MHDLWLWEVNEIRATLDAARAELGKVTAERDLLAELADTGGELVYVNGRCVHKRIRGGMEAWYVDDTFSGVNILDAIRAALETHNG